MGNNISIYTVAIVAVFGGIESLHPFTQKSQAEDFVKEWAKDNHPKNKEFKNADDAIEWFKNNDDKVDFTIELHMNELELLGILNKEGASHE